MSPTIIIVDDDPVIRTLISECLATGDYQLHSFESGQECLEQIKSIEPDILITDLQLPGISGIEIIRTLDTFDWQKKPKTILTSADGNCSTLCFTEKVDPDYVLTKPFQMKDLIAAVDYLLKN